MQAKIHPDSTVLAIFGAGGDLTWRKLVPALYSLYVDGWLPKHFAVIGLDMKPMTDDEFRAHLRLGVNEFSRGGKIDDANWATFAAGVSFLHANFGDAAAYATLADRLSKQDHDWKGDVTHIFYLATPPMLMEPIAQHLRDANLVQDRAHARIVV